MINKKRLGLFFGAVLFSLVIVSSLFVRAFLFSSPIVVSSDEQVSKVEKEYVDPSYELSIASLNLTIPIVLDVDARDEEVYNLALQEGAAHMLGTSYPGDGSNIVVFAHSSVSLEDVDQYDPIFERIGELEHGDKITITDTANDKSFYYVINGREVVDPEDMSLSQPTSAERLTLVTCWPIGSLESRLIVWAETDEKI